MPIPKPKKGESKDDFIGRCMSNETMKTDYPDRKQRFAVCMSSWRDKKKSIAGLVDFHTYLHKMYRQIKKGDEIENWTEDDIVSAHATVTHDLRKAGYKMRAKTELDRISKNLEPDHFKSNEITKTSLRNVSADFLYRTHKNLHNELNNIINLGDMKSLGKEIDIHELIVDELTRRKLIHPIWNNIDKFYSRQN